MASDPERATRELLKELIEEGIDALGGVLAEVLSHSHGYDCEREVYLRSSTLGRRRACVE